MRKTTKKKSNKKAQARSDKRIERLILSNPKEKMVKKKRGPKKKTESQKTANLILRLRKSLREKESEMKSLIEQLTEMKAQESKLNQKIKDISTRSIEATAQLVALETWKEKTLKSLEPRKKKVLQFMSATGLLLTEIYENIESGI